MSQASDESDIVVVTDKISPAVLRRLVDRFFGDMVKYVVDIEREIVAVGGGMHVDCEVVLLEHGGRQDDVWGANYFPGHGRDGCIEFVSLINIRPALSNRGMLIEDPRIRERVRAITFARIGEGEPLA